MIETILKGKFLVNKVISPVLFRIKGHKREVIVPHNRLKPCLDRSIPMWMHCLAVTELDLDETLPHEADEDLGIAKLFELPQQDIQERPKVSDNQETSINSIVRNNFTWPTNGPDSELVFTEQEPVEVALQAVGTGRGEKLHD